VTAIGVVTGTPLGEALATRLAADGRTVIAGLQPADVAQMATRARLIVIDAAPSALPELARLLGDHLDGNHLVAHTVRGLGPGGASPMKVLREASCVRRLGVIAGPLVAPDLAAGRPTAAVIASRHPEVVEEFAAALSTPRLRVYRGRDPVGVELASSLCDLVAIGCGLAHQLGFGETTRAVMMVRAVRELGRLIRAVGGDPETASGLAGLGDLLVRGNDTEGEAFRFGVAIATAPQSPEGRLAEVLTTARSLAGITRQHRVTTHIFDGLTALLAGKLNAGDLVAALMAVPVLDD
jgi:glycerol-3-phosphate dehydrogenase (NAD(P)+)